MSSFSIGVNDDRDLYLWMNTWKEDTVSDFLTRLSQIAPQLDRYKIHLSFDGVRLSESTTIREVNQALFVNIVHIPDLTLDGIGRW